MLMQKTYRHLIVIAPLAIFAFSFILEYHFHFKPCNLCIIERYSYLALFLTLCMLYFKPNILGILPAVFGISISVYHKLVQYGAFSTCHFFPPSNPEEFTAMVQNSVPCTTKMSILGIDAVYFNIMFFLLYLVIISQPKLRKFFFN